MRSQCIFNTFFHEKLFHCYVSILFQPWKGRDNLAPSLPSTILLYFFCYFVTFTFLLKSNVFSKLYGKRCNKFLYFCQGNRIKFCYSLVVSILCRITPCLIVITIGRRCYLLCFTATIKMLTSAKDWLYICLFRFFKTK